MGKWQPATSIDAVRSESRRAIFFSMFGAEFDPEERKEQRRQMACSFTEFGVSAGLISPDEGNEWLGAIWAKADAAPIGKVWQKWEHDPANVDDRAKS